MEKAVFRVIDIDRRRDVHGVHEAEPLLYFTLPHQGMDGFGDVDVIAPVRGLERQMLSQAFHKDVVLETGLFGNTGTAQDLRGASASEQGLRNREFQNP